MMLFQTCYNLSDTAVEDRVNDSLGARRFCQLELVYDVHDHSTLSRFRKELLEKRLLTVYCES
jgi:transposase, IS5 family